MKLVAPLLSLLCLTPFGCNNDDKKDTTTDTGGGYWAVGEDASMVRLQGEDLWFYPLAVEGDLLAIACKGKEAAVAVGAEGLVLRTEDGGSEWRVIEVGTRAPLRSVALSAGTAAFVVGDAVVLRSEDLGRSFTPVPGGEGASWRAVATTAAGTTAWLASEAGEVWRLREGELTPAFTRSEGPLAGIGVSPAGNHVIAVGAGGLVLRSDDSGETWASVAVPTARALHAVRIVDEVVVAVGEAGVVLRLDEQGASAQEHLDLGLALRALHLGADGFGLAVGDHGVALATADAGMSWEARELGLDVALFGLDDLAGEPLTGSHAEAQP